MATAVPPALDVPPFAFEAAEKTPFLLAGLNELTGHHIDACPDYKRMIKAIFGEGATQATELASVPWLPVRLFKRLELLSIARSDIAKTLTSSGTSGQAVSRIYLDATTAAAQTRALVRISADFLGSGRKPMLVLDDSSFLKDRSRFNARAAGILGFATLGRNHFYLLDGELRADWAGLAEWLTVQGDQPILLFGFTFIVWQQFVMAAKRNGVTLKFPRGSVLVHGGGWKRLEDQRVSAETFKDAIAETFGITQVHNYYGMVEQVGSIFFECENGRLHTPAYADVIVRDPMTLEVLSMGEAGVIEVLSLLPRSYPGHALLTEDLGTITGVDDCGCGRRGRTFAVHGRLKNVEIRGCSDTRAVP